MSIINDALKKVQQGQEAKAMEPSVPPTPAPSDPAAIYGTAQKSYTRIEDESSVEYLPSKAKKPVSIPQLLLAVVLVLGASWFLFKQVITYFPEIQKLGHSPISQLTHKKDDGYNFPVKDPKDFVPLAKINIPSATSAASSSSPDLKTPPVVPPAPKTLNVHGVMANGNNNLALINDKVYQEGDAIDGIKITKISLDSITVIKDGHEETIPVKN